MKGTWQTTSGGGGGGAALTIAAAAALCVAGGYLAQHLGPALTGAGAAAAGLAKLVLACVAAVVVLAVAAVAGVWQWRKHHPPAPPPWTARQLPTRRVQATTIPPDSAPPMAALPPGHATARSGGDVHLHLHGITDIDPAALAEAIRQAQANG